MRWLPCSVRRTILIDLSSEIIATNALFADFHYMRGNITVVIAAKCFATNAADLNRRYLACEY